MSSWVSLRIRCSSVSILLSDRFQITIDRAAVNPQNLGGARFVAVGLGEDQLNIASFQFRECGAIVNERDAGMSRRSGRRRGAIDDALWQIVDCNQAVAANPDRV